MNDKKNPVDTIYMDPDNLASEITDALDSSLPAEEEPVEVIPAEEEPVEVVPAEEEPVEVIPAEEETVEVVPAEEEPVEVVPAEEEPVEVISAEEEPVEVAPAEEEPAPVVPVKEESAEAPKAAKKKKKKKEAPTPVKEEKEAPAKKEKKDKKDKKAKAEAPKAAKPVKAENAAKPEDNDHGEDLGNISADALSKYLDEIDAQYDVRRKARQKRMRRKVRARKIRRFLFVLILLLIVFGGGSWYYLTYEDTLSFMFPEPLESMVHELDPVNDKINAYLAALGIKSAPEEELPPETEPATEPATEPETAEEETEEESIPETIADPDGSDDSEEEAPIGIAGVEGLTSHSNSLKQTQRGDEVASFFSGYSVNAEGAPELKDPYNDIVSSSAVLINVDTGEVVVQRNAEKVASPASMTKILTVLVAAEHLTTAQLNDTAALDAKSSDYVYQANSSTADLVLNDPITIRDLFYGTILPSGGDAAMTLAKYVAGSTEAFIDMMNAKVDELGLSDTAHFTNCVGLYDKELHCTMTDMAMIMKAAVENDWCRQVLSAHTYTTAATPAYPEGISYSNWFLRRIEDYDTGGEVRCAKTGFVDQAGCCAASYLVSREGTHYICVTGGSTSSWQCIYDQIKIYHDNVK